MHTPLTTLQPIDIPGSTGALDSGELGINLAAAQKNFPDRGLQVRINPWTNMAPGDRLNVILTDNSGPVIVASKSINIGEENQIVTAFIASSRLKEGSYSISYNVLRTGASTPEPSVPVDIYVKLTLPGGQDQNGDTPGHSALLFRLPEEVIANGVDKEMAMAGIKVTILPYMHITELDIIDLIWGSQHIRHEVSNAQAENPIQNPIEIVVDYETILAAEDSDELPVAFEVYDLVDNQSEDWSAEQRIVVDTASNRLLPPIPRKLVNGNTLDLDLLEGETTDVAVACFPPEFSSGDNLVLTLKGTTIAGVAVLETYAQRIENVPSVYDIPVSVALLRTLVKTTVSFSYELTKGNGSGTFKSKATFAIVTGQPYLLKAPTAIDASAGALDPDLIETTIEIPFDASMNAGDSIDLQWLGTLPDGSIYLPKLRPHLITGSEWSAQQPINMYIDGQHLKLIEGGTLELFYILMSSDSERKSLHTARLNVGEPRAELPAPHVDKVDGVIDPELFPRGVTLIVPMYNGIEAGDTVHYNWVGSKTGKTEDWIKLNSSSATREIPFQIAKEHVTPNLGGTIEASYWVERANGDVSQSNILPLSVGEAQSELLTPASIEGVVEGGVLDLKGIGEKGEVIVTIEPWISSPEDPNNEMNPGDQVFMTWTAANGAAPYTDYRSISGSMDNKPVLFYVPYADAIKFLDATVTVTYSVDPYDAEADDRTSAPLTFVVSLAESQLPAPQIKEARGDILNPGDAREGATVLIQKAGLKKNDQVTLEWKGQPGSGTVSKHKTVSQDGEDLEITVEYATVVANDGFDIELFYNVARADGSPQDPSASAEYSVMSTVGSGVIKVMGARYNRSTSRAYSSSQILMAFNANTDQPLTAQWQYQGDTAWVAASVWRDTAPWKVLQVRTTDDAVNLNPANIVGSGHESYTSTYSAFVAHRNKGAMTGWGHGSSGGDIPSTIITYDDVAEVSCTHSAYAARRLDGRVAVWGAPGEGGSYNLPLSDFVEVIPNTVAFAGIKTDGKIAAWGTVANGGKVPPKLSEYDDFRHLYGSGTAFAGLRNNGAVVAWGAAGMGGTVPTDIAGLTDIKQVVGNFYAFAAVRANKRIVAWGHASYGGAVPATIASLDNVDYIASGNFYAFAALLETKSVVAWGTSAYGGSVPSDIAGLTDIVSVVSTWSSFAAIRENGHVVAWGGSVNTGGTVPASIAQLDDIVQVAGNSNAFAALRKNGRVVAWGLASTGGDVSPVASHLTDVQAIYANNNAFVALTSDGRVVTWGDPTGGGNSSAVQEFLKDKVTYKATSASRGRGLMANRWLLKHTSSKPQPR